MSLKPRNRDSLGSSQSGRGRRTTQQGTCDNEGSNDNAVSSAAPQVAAPTGTDYYSRNQYHVHGGYSKPSGPSYDNSGFSTASYSNHQVSHLSDIPLS